jgi:formylglycine-generating enzyme required for sulfatase activity
MASELLVQFTMTFIGGLAANLSGRILEESAREVRKLFRGDPEQKALERCVKVGLIGALSVVSLEKPERKEAFEEKLEAVFQEKDTARELCQMLSGRPPKVAELVGIASDGDLDSAHFPGFQAEAVFSAFEAAFLQAAIREDVLRPLIDSGNLMEQTRLQRALLDRMDALVEFLQKARPWTVRIEAGTIIAENVVGGNQVFHGAPVQVAASNTPPDNWEFAYLNRLMDRCDPLDLAAVDETVFRDGSEARMVRVSDVYTSLYLKNSSRSAVEAIGSLKPVDEKNTGKNVDAQRCLVVLGQPGGGKSTLLNHIAAHLARLRSVEAVLSPLNGWEKKDRPLPVRVILRDFAAWAPEEGRGTEQLVWDFLEAMLLEWGCPDFFPTLRRALEYEGGVVFFDGLDEVSEADESKKRTRLVSAIEAFARSLRKCRVVVTCREYAYRGTEEWRLPANLFPVVELDQFQDEQIQAFLVTWFSASREQRGWSREKAEAEAEFLFREISEREHLRELAPNPLLLTLMAIVHGASGLPENRADLYERAVVLLLAAWENRVERDANGCRVRPSEIAKLGIPVRTLRGPLERLALKVHEKQEAAGGNRSDRADISRISVLEELCVTLGDDVVKAKAVVEYIENRAGLLQGHGGNTFRFPHRTFQEYLTATGLLRLSDPETALADRVRRDPDYWREVFLLAAGASRGRPKGIYDQIDALLPEYAEGKAPTPEIALYARLSAQAIHETGFMEHVRSDVPEGRFKRIHKRVEQWLLAATVADEALKPPERNEAGTALNWVGDPRFQENFHFLPDDDLFGFVRVSGGPFRMGSDKANDKKAGENETPEHEVTLPEYYIGRFPVTVAQFRAYVDATGERPKDERSLKGPDNHPVVYVSWHEAMAYCRWLQTVLETSEAPALEPIRQCLAAGWRVRLPTEAEWERAARGTDGRVFPWGKEADPNRANYDKSGIRGTSAVGCFSGGRTPAGCLEMSGNVWEWTVSVFAKKYPYIHDREWNNETAGDDSARVVRGGAFFFTVNGVRCAFRRRYDPDYRRGYGGFRFCVAPNPTL